MYEIEVLFYHSTDTRSDAVALVADTHEAASHGASVTGSGQQLVCHWQYKPECLGVSSSIRTASGIYY